MKGQLNLFIIGGGLLVLIVGFILIASSGGGISGQVTGNDLPPKQLVECNVEVVDPVFGGPTFGVTSCEIIEECRFNLFSAVPLGIISNEGTVRMQMGSEIDRKKYSTLVAGGSDDLTLKICTRETSGSLKLTDEEDNVIDQRSFTVGGN